MRFGSVKGVEMERGLRQPRVRRLAFAGFTPSSQEAMCVASINRGHAVNGRLQRSNWTSPATCAP